MFLKITIKVVAFFLGHPVYQSQLFVKTIYKGKGSRERQVSGKRQPNFIPALCRGHTFA